MEVMRWNVARLMRLSKKGEVAIAVCTLIMALTYRRVPVSHP